MTTPATLGPLFQVNTYTQYSQIRQSMEVFSDGSYIVVWQSGKSGAGTPTPQDGDKYGIYAQRFSSDGEPIGSEFRVNLTTEGSQRDPTITILPDDRFLIAWLDEDTNCINGRFFHSDGSPSGAELLLHAGGAYQVEQPALLQLSNGEVFATWLSYRENLDTGEVLGSIFGQRIDANGTKIGDTILLTDHKHAVNTGSNTAIALDQGGFATITTSNVNSDNQYDIVMHVFDANFEDVSGQISVQTHTNGWQRFADAAILNDGSFVVVWDSEDGQDGRYGGIYAQRFASNGEKIGSETLINENGEEASQVSASIIALKDGGYVIAWSTDSGAYGLFGRRYDADGQAIGDEFLINDNGRGNYLGTLNSNPEMAVIDENTFVVSWHTQNLDGEIVARHFTLDGNSGPVFESPTNFSLDEAIFERNETLATVIASDLNGDVIRYSITGGADADYFAIDHATGEITYDSSSSANFNYESPFDANEDNVYELEITAHDNHGLSAIQNVSLTIQNVNDIPYLGNYGTFQIYENILEVGQISASDEDEDQTLIYSITGGTDANLFSIGETTGLLAFTNAPDFENPSDSNIDNVYNLEVSVNDGVSEQRTQQVTVHVYNAQEAPVFTSPASISILENQTSIMTVQADSDDGEPVNYRLANGGDNSYFTIDQVTGALSFIAPPDYETPLDADGDNVYSLAIYTNVTGGIYNAEQNLQVTVTNENENPIFISPQNLVAEENQLLAADIGAYDPENDDVQFAISGGADAERFSIDPTTGQLIFLTEPNFEAPSDFNQDGNYEVSVTATDEAGRATTQSFDITVTNVLESFELPDLLATDLTIASSSANVGDTVSVTFNISNIGAVASGEFGAGIYISADPTLGASSYYLGSFRGLQLAQEETVEDVPLNVQIPSYLAAGDWYVIAVADDWLEVTESSEANNITPHKAITISRPDTSLFTNSDDVAYLSVTNSPWHALDGNDFILGTSSPDEIHGGAGHDNLVGLDGIDKLYGGEDDDTIEGGRGNDIIDGGSGYDTAVYYINSSNIQLLTHDGVSAMLAGEFEGNDVLHNIEAIRLLDTTIAIDAAVQFSALDYIASNIDLISVFGTNTSDAFNHYINYGHDEGRHFSFDGAQYLAANTDLITAFGNDTEAAASHFIQYGYAEGRSQTFDGLSYVASYTDLIGAFGADEEAAISHYISYGHSEGRITWFDGMAYLASHPDLIAAFGSNELSAAEHFIQYGFAEGRGIDFDVRQYLENNADLAEYFGTDLDGATAHYVKWGASEGRVWFNGLEYIASYSDLMDAFGADAEIGLQHYSNWGRSEMRTQSFDGLEYIASHVDLIDAYGSDDDAGAMHYINYGRQEGRETSFDAIAYLQANADLVSAFGMDLELATIHYIEHGYAEGRSVS